MKTLLVFLIGGAISWLFRVAFIALAPHGHVPAGLVRPLKNAAPAAFAALVTIAVSDAARGGGSGDLAGWPVIAATAITAAVALRSRNTLATLIVGAAAITGFAAW